PAPVPVAGRDATRPDQPPPPAPADAANAREPVIPPPAALMFGLMPLRSTGVDAFRAAYPRYDGRGVLIAILDSGVDPGVAGLVATSTGAPKILDVRDFSGEGRVTLSLARADDGGRITVGARVLTGAGRISRLATAAPWYAGVFRELPLGLPPAGDVNGNGRNTDEFPVVVIKALAGWAAFLDSDLDGTFEDETPLHDYRQGRETIALGRQPLTLAANFSESAEGAPVLDLFFDTSGHGTHVAGIAAGHAMFNLRGFDGVAPGAQLLALKIANNARGGVSVHGSMLRAMDYAARFAAQRNLPLVLNLSFGVGNEHEGRAVIDSIVDAFLRAHPDVVFAISAGNDGPGLSTVGFPGSADLALSVGATYPGAFAQPPQPGQAPPPDVVGWFSARGGELAKPDVVTPGVAFSVVPPWDTGNEIKGGTSMAAPHAAGLLACLISAMAQEGRTIGAAELLQALRVSARPLAIGGRLDQGVGVPNLLRAYEWLGAAHQGSMYDVRARSGASGAYRRNGFTGAAADTVETFAVRHVAGLRAAHFLLRADVPWLVVPAAVEAAPRTTEIPVVYRRSALAAPGLYVGTIRALNPNDTLAGPLFRLVNTIIIPHDLAARPLVDERRTIPAAGVQRYFVRVPKPGATLHASVALADAGSPAPAAATVRLYEPNGAPARSAPEDVELGGESGPREVEITVRGDETVSGVYELDVTAPPLASVPVTVRVELGPVALVPAGGRSLEAASVLTAGGTVNAQVTHRLLGAERRYVIAGRGEPAETLFVRPPAWTTYVEVDLQLPPALWDELTDFSLTVYDSTGQQIPEGNEAVNYAFGRLRFALPDAFRGRRLTIELYPAFARRTGHPWRGEAAVRFLGPDEPIGEGGEVAVVSGGRVVVRLPEPAPSFELPAGFATLIETQVRSSAGAIATRRVQIGPGGAAPR
ncbi:MAG: S8 family serine peptidase, partial [Gemmatimonadales bacterium]